MGVGCAQGHPADSESLAQPVQIQVGSVEEGNVTFTIQGGFSDSRVVEMPVAAPTIKLHTTGEHAELDALTLPLGDIMVPATALPPSGLQLRNLVLTAGPAHAQVMHAQDDALELRAKLPLTLQWSVQLQDGSLYRLGPVHTDAVNLDVNVVRAGGITTATLQAGCLGNCWSVDGVAQLSDGALYLLGNADVTPAH
jgi:hypothetical protein